jgi:hypothetical protein
MEKKTSEMVQVLIFAVIVIGQLFLAYRYSAREDLVGTIIFAVVAILAAVAAFGHLIEWRKL